MPIARHGMNPATPAKRPLFFVRSIVRSLPHISSAVIYHGGRLDVIFADFDSDSGAEWV